MCDYSLHLVASRPAKVGDKLVATDFVKSITGGFAAVGEPDVAVCLLPGTELAFEENVQYQRAFSLFGRACVDHKVARFRQVNVNDPNLHHDALEFPSGQIVKVTRLVAGQRATVLQLPASTRDHGGAKENAQVSSPDGPSNRVPLPRAANNRRRRCIDPAAPASLQAGARIPALNFHAFHAISGGTPCRDAATCLIPAAAIS